MILKQALAKSKAQRAKRTLPFVRTLCSWRLAPCALYEFQSS